MASLIDPCEREIPILAHLAVLHAVDEERSVARSPKFFGVRVVYGKRDGFAAEPVADVVCVSIDESDADAILEDLFDVFEEVGVDEVASALEAERDVGRIGARIIDVYTQGLLRGFQVEEVHEVVWWRGVVVWMADVVDAAAAEFVVGLLDEGAAEVGCHCACELAVFGGAVRELAPFDLVAAAAGHVVGLLHEVVDCVVDGFDAIGVVDGELGIVGCLNA